MKAEAFLISFFSLIPSQNMLNYQQNQADVLAGSGYLQAGVWTWGFSLILIYQTAVVA